MWMGLSPTEARVSGLWRVTCSRTLVPREGSRASPQDGQGCLRSEVRADDREGYVRSKLTSLCCGTHLSFNPFLFKMGTRNTAG